MSSAELSENLDEWPDDPFQLLGVERGVTERDLKRAYTRRIKLFKPEQFPLHFRRLRDAYEWIKTHILPDPTRSAPDQIVLDTASTLWEPPFRDPTAPGATNTNEPPSPPSEESVAPRNRWQQMTSAWRQAVAGDAAAAYARLLTLLQQSSDPELYVRLYWLLRAAPEVDANRAALDWLAEGITRYGFTGQLSALYAQVLKFQPLEAASDRCNRLLTVQQQPGYIIDLLQARWLAYDVLSRQSPGQETCADAIFSDVEQIRPRFRRFDEQAQSRLLILAIEHLSWRPTLRGADLAKLLIDELEKGAAGAQGLDYFLYHMEGVGLNSGNWRKALRAAPPKESVMVATILDVIRIGAIQPPEEAQASLNACIEQIAAAPGEALAALDFIEAKGPGVTILWANMVNMLGYENPHERMLVPNAWRIQRVYDFVSASKWFDYSNFRVTLLQFSLNHCVSPRTVRELIADQPTLRRADGIHLGDLIGSDVALDCVFEASRLFWA